MKNQYNAIKEKLEQGFFVLVKGEGYSIFATSTESFVFSNRWSSDKEECKKDFNFDQRQYDKEELENYDLEIVEYFRPNDLFPSKEFNVAEEVAVNLGALPPDLNSGVEYFFRSPDLKVEYHDSIKGRYSLYSNSKQRSELILEKYVYPRIEKQEEYMLCPVCGKRVDHINDIYTSEIQKQNWDGAVKTERFHTDCYKKVEEKKAINLIISQATQKALEDAGYTITKK
jgi:hypothetical protein